MWRSLWKILIWRKLHISEQLFVGLGVIVRSCFWCWTIDEWTQNCNKVQLCKNKVGRFFCMYTTIRRVYAYIKRQDFGQFPTELLWRHFFVFNRVQRITVVKVYECHPLGFKFINFMDFASSGHPHHAIDSSYGFFFFFSPSSAV